MNYLLSTSASGADLIESETRFRVTLEQMKMRGIIEAADEKWKQIYPKAKLGLNMGRFVYRSTTHLLHWKDMDRVIGVRTCAEGITAGIKYGDAIGLKGIWITFNVNTMSHYEYRPHEGTLYYKGARGPPIRCEDISSYLANLVLCGDVRFEHGSIHSFLQVCLHFRMNVDEKIDGALLDTLVKTKAELGAVTGELMKEKSERAAASNQNAEDWKNNSSDWKNNSSGIIGLGKLIF